MIDELRAMAIFAETADQGSFRKAATSLGLSPSVVSYHISRLEQSLETPLLYRTTRNLSLTHEGQVLYARAKTMLSMAKAGLEEISTLKQQLSGKIVITLPTALTQHSLTNGIADFSTRHPELRVQLLFTDARQDLIAEGIDLAIRAGTMPDSSLKSRSLGVLERKLVCSTQLYRSRPAPLTPFDVQNWPWIHLIPMPQSREISDPEGNKHRLQFQSRFEVNNVEAMGQLCLQGLGVATPPAYLMTEALESERAIEICPHWQVTPIPLYAVWPYNKAIHAGVRALLDYLSPV